MLRKEIFQNFNLAEVDNPDYPIMVACRVRDPRMQGDWEESWTVASLSREEVKEVYEFLKKFLEK